MWQQYYTVPHSPEGNKILYSTIQNFIYTLMISLIGFLFWGLLISPLFLSFLSRTATAFSTRHSMVWICPATSGRTLPNFDSVGFPVSVSKFANLIRYSSRAAMFKSVRSSSQQISFTECDDGLPYRLGP